MDYKNGKIYKITSNSTDKIYIGSTCQLLCKRIAKHRGNYKEFLDGKYSNVSSYELIKFDDAIITLIEDYPCERKEQLLSRERYYIELNKDICVNKIIPTRTPKEYNRDNQERLSAQQKQWREANANKVKQYQETRKEQIQCICGMFYSKRHKARHEKSKKHLDNIL